MNGCAAAEKLVIAHQHLLNRWAGFESAADAMLTTDRQLFGGRYHHLIRNVFERRGVLLRPWHAHSVAEPSRAVLRLSGLALSAA